MGKNSNTIKKLVPGTPVAFCYAADYQGPDDWKIVKEEYVFIGAGKEPRYRITNGVVEVGNVRIKDFYACSAQAEVAL